jgi:hypothetical protein
MPSNPVISLQYAVNPVMGLHKGFEACIMF